MAHPLATLVADPHVTRVRLELAQLRQTGTLVNVSVQGLSRLFKRISWDELGIDKDDLRKKLFTRGVKALFREELYRPLQSMDARVRANLNRYAYDITGFAPWRYLHVSAYFRWRDQHLALVEEFNGLKAVLLAAYDDERDRVARDFSIVAFEAWHSLDGRRMLPSDSRTTWVADLVERAVGQMPTYGELDGSLQITYTTAIIDGQAELLADAHATDLASVSRRAEVDQVREMHRIERERVVAALREMESPFAETLRQLRDRIATEVSELLDTVKRHGFLPGRSAAKARGLQELYALLATQDMPELESRLQALNAALDLRPSAPVGGRQFTYDADAVRAALLEIAAVVATPNDQPITREDAVAFGEPGREVAIDW